MNLTFVGSLSGMMSHAWVWAFWIGVLFLTGVYLPVSLSLSSVHIWAHTHLFFYHLVLRPGLAVRIRGRSELLTSFSRTKSEFCTRLDSGISWGWAVFNACSGLVVI